MHEPDPVETILARLMPPGLSDEGQRGVEAMLDELAGVPAEVGGAAVPSGISWGRRMIVAGIAAAVVAAAVAFPLIFQPSASPVVAVHASEPPPAEFILMGESDRVESMTDEGWQEDPDGSAVRAVRLNVVEENSLLDEETGIVMQVSEPREEIFLMPVSTF